MLRYHPLAQEGPHLAGEALKEEGVGLSCEAVDCYSFELGPIGVVVFVVGEPGEMALLSSAGRTHKDEAVAPEL